MRAALTRLVLFAALLSLPACSLSAEDEGGGEGDGDSSDEPRFAPGEYGGDALDGTEHIYSLVPSPDGERIALIRKRTPGTLSDPRYQLWITDRDGSNPRLVGVNVLGADWSPDGDKLSLTVARGIDFYAHTLNLRTGDHVRWNGLEDQFFSKPTVSSGNWFSDNKHLLVFVAQKAYQQSYERGIYTINTATGAVEGPHVEFMQSTSLGNGDQYVTGKKYVENEDPRSGNYAKYTFATDEWHWVTDFGGREALEDVGILSASPVNDQLVQARETENADQLFFMDSEGENVRQITDLGGDNPRWSHDGTYFTFRRDVHHGEGARYVPFKFDLDAMRAEPLFPAQPDSLPQFPPLSEATTPWGAGAAASSLPGGSPTDPQNERSN